MAFDWANYHLSWRAFLTLGRVSNLGTVWSNVLASWLLSGGGSWGRLTWLIWGCSCLYLGGMFLNDAFDVESDRLRRPDRPIPSGRATLQGVWVWGVAWLFLGLLSLMSLGPAVGVMALFLAAAIVLYDALHKALAFAPAIMGLCRTLLYWTAGVATAGGLHGMSLWHGLVAGVYVGGLSVLARRETRLDRPPAWPVALLVVPVLFALMINHGPYRAPALMLSCAFLTWTAVAGYALYGQPQAQTGRAVGVLLSGIIWVDLLAILAHPPGAACLLGVLFVATLIAQRYIPAS